MESEEAQQPSDGRRQQPGRAAKAAAAALAAHAAAAGAGPPPDADSDTTRDRAAAELIALAQSEARLGTPEGRLVRGWCCAARALGRAQAGFEQGHMLAPSQRTAPACSCAQILGQGQSKGVAPLILLAWAVFLRKQCARSNAAWRDAAAKQAPRMRLREVVEMGKSRLASHMKGSYVEAVERALGCAKDEQRPLDELQRRLEEPLGLPATGA